MKKQNGFIKTPILIIIILSFIILSGVGYFITYKIKINNTNLNNDLKKEIEEFKDQPVNKNQNNTQTETTTVKNQNNKSPQIEQNFSYITKNGIKIYYPSSYIYSSVSMKSNAEKNTCFQYQLSNHMVANSICPNIPPETLSEGIKFGFPSNTNTETITIMTSDFGNFENNACNYGPNNESFSQTTMQISGKSVLHAIQLFSDTEYYCVVTPAYSFVLSRNKNNGTKIDVNDIIFP